MAPPAVVDEWAESAASWDDDPHVQAYAEAALRTLLEVCRNENLSVGQARVLDFGCGTARLGRALAQQGADVVAFDTSPAMLDQLRARLTADGPATVTPVSALTEEHRDFDLIVASSVLGFVPDLTASVGDLAARLKPGGLLVQWDWEAKTGDDDGLTPRAIEDAYADAGLALRSLETGFVADVEGTAMAPLMGVARR
ncbi:MAG: class I SAM-dependent DNA methyltransferase [Nannocystales bacterium]